MKRTRGHRTAWVMSAIMCIQPLAAAQRAPGGNSPQAGGRNLRVEELLGEWKGEGDGKTINIEQLYLNDPGRKNELKFSGDHDWGGGYRDGSLGFRRAPKFEEMNSTVPLWARKMVEGQLSWTLELKAEEEGCGGPVVLKGRWHPGEITWREEKNPGTGEVVKREASVTGKGEPREVRYTRAVTAGEGDEGGWISKPSIIVRSAVRPVPDSVLDSVHRDEPFHVEVKVSQEQAAAIGPTLDVKFRVTKTRDTAGLRLSSAGSGIRGPVIYKAPGPVTLGGGGTGGGITRLLGLEISRGDMSAISIEKEDTVVVSYGDVAAEFKAYTHPIQQAVARVEASLNARRSLYESMLQDPQIPAADKKVARTKLRLVTNARRIMESLDGNRPRLPVLSDDTQMFSVDHQELSVGAEHLKLLDDPARWRGPWLPLYPGGQLVDDPRFPGVSYHSQVEKDVVDRGLEQGAIRFFQETSNTLRQLSSDLILFGISTTGADQFVILCFGITSTGERVDTTERVLAGISLGSQALLSGALAARPYRSLLKESESAARKFEREVLSGTGRPGVGAGGGLGGAGARGAARPTLVARRTAVIGAEVDLEKVANAVNTETTLPGARLFSERGYLLQEFDDTCGPTVGEQIRRKGGLPPRTERENMIKAYELGKAYRAGYGMTKYGMADFLNFAGASIEIPIGVTLRDIERRLIGGRQAAVLINTAEAGKLPVWHWVEVEEIVTRSNGKRTVVYGDPWNGNIWEVDSCVFLDRMSRDDVLFAKWDAGKRRPAGGGTRPKVVPPGSPLRRSR